MKVFASKNIIITACINCSANPHAVSTVNHHQSLTLLNPVKKNIDKVSLIIFKPIYSYGLIYKINDDRLIMQYNQARLC